MDMNVANQIYDAATRMNEAAEKFTKAIVVMAQIEGMKAANKEREINGQSLAYTEHNFDFMAQKLDPDCVS